MHLKNWLFGLLCLFAGSTVGTGAYTIYYSGATAYLSNRPEACTQCHAMNDPYKRWQMSSHHHVARCNDCHASGSFLEKYWGKARSGFLHSYAFTFGYQEPIRIKEYNRQVTETSCRACHLPFLENSHFNQQNSCLHCHSEVGHRKQ